MLFHRDYHGYTGGHGKIRDYIDHVQAHPDWSVGVHLSPASDRGAGNPFLDAPGLTDRWQPDDADALLLGGMDWAVLPASAVPAAQPVVNLVQGVRHAESGRPLRGFLSRRAVRVCVSTAVAAAIAATGEVNGPIRVIPAAVDSAMLASVGERTLATGVFIDAVKQPALGAEIALELARSGVPARLHANRLPRADYLGAMAAAAVVVTLPDPMEGFYLPGLEALALGRALVQYDCLGSRDYLRDGDNALVPSQHVSAIIGAVMTLHADAALRARLSEAGRATAARFDLASERASVHQLLDELDNLWQC